MPLSVYRPRNNHQVPRPRKVKPIKHRGGAKGRRKHNTQQHNNSGGGGDSHHHGGHDKQSGSRSGKEPAMHSESVPELVSKMEAGESKLLVVCRVRPLASEERKIDGNEAACVVGKNMVVLMDPNNDDGKDVLRMNRSREKRYAFDMAFGPQATQEEIYEGSCKFLLPGVLQGFNATVFAYGPTGAGKTFTMVGNEDKSGVMIKAISELFDLISQSDGNYTVVVSYVEIYNECLRDLLIVDSPDLELREDSEGNSVVCGLRRVKIKTPDEIYGLLEEGNQRRTQEATAANRTSSRSHAVLEVKVERIDKPNLDGQKVSNEVRSGRLFLIDLAGSERAANTGNTGIRMVEGQHINRSLLALGNCINSLGGPHRARYVNYRDSKLTRILKDSLGGNCRTVMIACASPASQHFEETYNTMNYANRAKNIKTKVARNVSKVDVHVTEYMQIIANLRKEVSTLKRKLDGDSDLSADLSASEAPTSHSNLRQRQEHTTTSSSDEKHTPRGASVSPTSDAEALEEPIIKTIEQTLAEHKKTSEEITQLNPPTEVSPVSSAMSGEDLERRRNELLEQLKERSAATDRLYAQVQEMPLNLEQKRLSELMFKNHRLELKLLQDAHFSRTTEQQVASLAAVTKVLHEARDLRDQVIDQQKVLLGKEVSDMPAGLKKLYADLEALRAREISLGVVVQPVRFVPSQVASSNPYDVLPPVDALHGGGGGSGSGSDGFLSGGSVSGSPPINMMMMAGEGTSSSIEGRSSSTMEMHSVAPLPPIGEPTAANEKQSKDTVASPPLSAPEDSITETIAEQSNANANSAHDDHSSKPLLQDDHIADRSASGKSVGSQRVHTPALTNSASSQRRSGKMRRGTHVISTGALSQLNADGSQGNELPVVTNPDETSSNAPTIDVKTGTTTTDVTPRNNNKKDQLQSINNRKTFTVVPTATGGRDIPHGDQEDVNNSPNIEDMITDNSTTATDTSKQTQHPNGPSGSESNQSPSDDLIERPRRFETHTVALATKTESSKLPTIQANPASTAREQKAGGPGHASGEQADDTHVHLDRTYTKTSSNASLSDLPRPPSDHKPVKEEKKKSRHRSNNNNTRGNKQHTTSPSSSSSPSTSPTGDDGSSSSSSEQADVTPFPVDTRPVRVGTPVVGMRASHPRAARGLPYKVPVHPTAVKQSKSSSRNHRRSRVGHKPPRVAKGRAPNDGSGPGVPGGLFNLSVERSPYNNRQERGLRYA